MKKLITIILALIMTLISAPQKSADQARVTDVETPRTAITTSLEQVPETSETTEVTAFVSEDEAPKIKMEIEETTATESKNKPAETEMLTEENPPLAQETIVEESTEIAEIIIITKPKEETVECIDHGDQSLAEYKPQIGGQPNPFENKTPTEIDDRPVEDYVGEGGDRPGEGIHF